MSKVLIIAESGFGKTTAVTGSEKYGIRGLSPEDTFIISATSKPIPGKGSLVKWKALSAVVGTQVFFNKTATTEHLRGYRRLISNKAENIAHCISLLGTIPIYKNIVLDDTNYVMQDEFMAKALQSGWDNPKKIGYDMGKIFDAMEKLPPDVNFFMLAHGEEYDKVGGKKGYRMKTTGKMVQEFITPEGKFDVVLIGTSRFDEVQKRAVKEFVTNDDGVFTTAKSHEIFDSLYIPNDLGYVVEKINNYYLGVD